LEEVKGEKEGGELEEVKRVEEGEGRRRVDKRREEMFTGSA
jgi:hypothetical protein